MTFSPQAFAHKPPSIKLVHQQGAALIIGLIIVTLLTTIAVASFSNTLISERIAANKQDRHLALEGAQSALAVGIDRLSKTDNTQVGRAHTQYYQTLDQGTAEAPPDISTWDDDSSYPFDSAVWPNPPRYKIEEFSSSQHPGVGDGVSEQQRSIFATTYYRIIGRGQGRDARSQAIVESVVMKME